MRKIISTISFIILLIQNLQVVSADGLTDIEIFDVSEGKVVQHITNTPEIQQEIRKMLDTINGYDPKIQGNPENGIIIKIPVEPSVEVKNQWFNDWVSEILLFVSAAEEPRILLFTDENRSIFVQFTHDVQPFLSKIGYDSTN